MRIRGLVGGLIAAVILGTPSFAATVEVEQMTVDELRSLVTEQQRSIDELRVAVDDLSRIVQDSHRPEPAAPPASNDIYDLRRRTSSLERLLGNTRIGGWLDFVYQNDTDDGTDQFFDAQHFYLYFDNRINEHWQAFAELEFEHAPEVRSGSTSGVIKLDRLYLQYNHAEFLRLRAGKFRTPFGYWTPVHWAISVDTIRKPIHEDNGYVPSKQVGLEIGGDFFPHFSAELPTQLTYELFLSNGPESSGTNQPLDDHLGGGFDLRATFADSYMVGLSGYYQRNPGALDRDEHSLMFYTDLSLPFELTFRGEYLHQERNRGFSDIDVGYVKLRYDFWENAYVNYRVGYGDDEKRGAGETHWSNLLTLGYRPHRNIRLRLEYGRHEFEAASAGDFDSYGVFLGYVF